MTLGTYASFMTDKTSAIFCISVCAELGLIKKVDLCDDKEESWVITKQERGEVKNSTAITLKKRKYL